MGRYIRIRGTGFIQAIKKFNLLIQKYHGKLLQICTGEIPGEYINPKS
jgi:hypothetical protein